MVRRRRDGNESSRITLAPGVLAVPNVKLVGKIAEGGMGSVWEAEHLSLRTNVAVKFVLDELGENAEAAARFDREATAAARIKSPHVVQTLDHGVTSDGVAYIVMELLEGEDLEARLVRDKKLPLELVAHLITQAAKALEKAHGLGIVHRDIKPSNVYLTDVGGEVFVKVLDFGIAKLSLANAAQMRVTQTGSMIGTPVFMAPEQMTQAKDVGPAADMWSLGVVAYVAATGKLPYDSDTIAGLAMAIERGVFPPATSVAPELPPAIDGWFDHALSKDPAGRFTSIREMADAMAKVAGTHIPISMALQSKPLSTPPPSVKGEAELPAEKPEKKDIALSRPAQAAALPSPEAAAMATTLQASPIASATIMGASSEKARQEVRSSTRTLVFAGVAICSLGAGAVLYGVFRSNTEPSTGSATAPIASATESASSRAALPTRDRPPPTEPRSASATSAAPPPETASASEIESSAPSQSVSASASARLTGTLPRVVPPSTPRPTAHPSASAPPKPSVSVSAAPAPSAPAPKPSASAPPPPAPSVSAKAPPKTPSAKPPP